MAINITNILNNAKAHKKVEVTHGGSSVYSFGIVNSEGNGKRLSLSKAMVTKLGIENVETVYVAISEEDNAVLISESASLNYGHECNVKKSGEKRILYSAGAVKDIVNTFGIPFEGITSRSYNHMEFDVLPDNKPVVCIYIKDLGQGTKNNEND